MAARFSEAHTIHSTMAAPAPASAHVLAANSLERQTYVENHQVLSWLRYLSVLVHGIIAGFCSQSPDSTVVAIGHVSLGRMLLLGHLMIS